MSERMSNKRKRRYIRKEDVARLIYPRKERKGERRKTRKRTRR